MERSDPKGIPTKKCQQDSWLRLARYNGTSMEEMVLHLYLMLDLGLVFSQLLTGFRGWKLVVRSW